LSDCRLSWQVARSLIFSLAPMQLSRATDSGLGTSLPNQISVFPSARLPVSLQDTHTRENAAWDSTSQSTSSYTLMIPRQNALYIVAYSRRLLPSSLLVSIQSPRCSVTISATSPVKWPYIANLPNMMHYHTERVCSLPNANNGYLAIAPIRQHNARFVTYARRARCSDCRYRYASVSYVYRKSKNSRPSCCILLRIAVVHLELLSLTLEVECG
jgi:hypothetical protein